MLQTGELCFQHPVGRGAEMMLGFIQHKTQSAQTKNYPAENTASVKIKKLWCRYLIYNRRMIHTNPE